MGSIVPPFSTGKQNDLPFQALFPPWIGLYTTRLLTPSTRSPLSSLVHRDELSLTGVCWLSPTALVSTPLYSLNLQRPAEVLVEYLRSTCGVLVEVLAETSLYTLTWIMLVIMKSNHHCNMTFIYPNITHYYTVSMLINLCMQSHLTCFAMIKITHIQHQCRVQCETNLSGSYFLCCVSDNQIPICKCAKLSNSPVHTVADT